MFSILLLPVAVVAFASAASAAAAPVVNYTLSYADGSSLRAELLAADGSAVRVVVVPAGASEAFLRYELRVPQPALPAGAGFAVEDHAGYALLATAASVLNVSKAAPTAQLLRPDGALLSAELQAVSREPESQCGNGHGGPIRGGCLRAWRSIQPGEGLYGFGVQSYAVDHVGTTKWVQTDANPAALGLDHAPAPFFLSSRGYGVALNTHAYSYFDVGFAFPANGSAPGINLVHTSDPVVDLVFFAGPRLADVMAQFTQLYGRTSLPPKFALGLWYHPKEDTNQSGIVETVAAFQANGVRLSAVTLEPPWQTHSYSCTYVINNKTIWDMPALIASLRGYSAEVSLWQHAYIFNESQGLASPLWSPVHGAGLAADWITWGGATPDWTLQATRDVVGKYMSDNFISLGIAAFKLDECDGNAGQTWFFPDSASFPSGFSGAQMHNLFGLTYTFAYHELFESLGLRTFLKARAAYMGAGRFPTTMYSDSYDYGQYVLATANSGFLSLSWAPELRSAATPSEFARRAQLMLFSGLASEDAWDTGFLPFPPFVNASSAAIYKAAYSARLELAPALYAAYAQQSAVGLPAVRHPLIDFDSDCAALGAVVDEFMLASLLVAPGPIGGTSRSVYFPAGSGEWVDFFSPTTSPKYSGGSSYNISCPDEVLPAFQQASTVVPLADLADGSVLRLRAVAGAAGAGAGPLAAIYDDDGKSLRYRGGESYEAAARIEGLSAGDGIGSGARVRLSIELKRAGWRPAWRTVRWEVAFPGLGGRLGGAGPAAVACTRGGAAVAATAAVEGGLLVVTHAAPAAGEEAAGELACEASAAAAAAAAATTFDCGIRQLMLEFAHSLQPSRRQADFDEMRDSLSSASAAMPANNGTPCALEAPRAATASPAATAAAAAAAGTFYMSPTGSDAGAGSAQDPYATIERAVAAARSLPPGAPRAVELLAGTHFLNGSEVRLGAADSGLAFASAAGAFVSGGTPLAGLAWSRAPPEVGGGRAWQAQLDAAAFPSLPRVLGLRSLLSGRRLPRARFPDVADLERDSVLDTGILAPPGAWRAGPHLQPARVLYPAYPFRDDFAIMQHYTLGFAAEGSGCAGFTPPFGFWCSNLTGRESNGTGFFSRPSGVSLNSTMLPNLPYANLTGAVLQTWMSGRWFSVAFELDQALADWDAAAGVLNLTLAFGGFQGSRGYASGLDIAVENVLEELTARGEWYFNSTTRTLFLIPLEGDAPPPDLTLVALGPGSATLFSILGSQAAPVVNVSFTGIGFTDAAITYLEPHAIPSGGDWAIARTAAVFAEGVEGLAVAKCNFTALDNNALFLSGYSRGASVVDSAFTSLGESAIALWGRVGGEEATGAPGFGWDTRNGDQPRFTLVARNLCSRIGIWQKQSACLFQAEAALTTIADNIFFDVPRAAINDNELGMGGSVVSRNAAWSVCRETADHGVWNSWSRTARVNDLLTDGQPGGPPSTTPLWTHASGNFWIAQQFPRTRSGFAPGAQEAFDTDDGSAHVNVTANVFVYGQSSLKSDLGGHDNRHDGNVILFVERGFGVDPGVLPGHADSFANNTVVYTQDGAIGGGQVCAAGPTRTRVLGNRYIMPSGGASECNMALRAWQALDPAANDPGSVAESYPADLDEAAVAWARAVLGLA